MASACNGRLVTLRPNKAVVPLRSLGHHVNLFARYERPQKQRKDFVVELPKFIWRKKVKIGRIAAHGAPVKSESPQFSPLRTLVRR